MDPAELKQTRFAFREKMETAATEKLQKVYVQQYDPDTMSSAKRDVSKMLNEEAEEQPIWKRLQRQTPQQRNTTGKSDWER